MAGYNPNSGYGQMLMNQIASHVPGVLGKILIVCPTTDKNYDRLADIFPSDPDGYVRLYSTLELACAAVTSNENDVVVLAGYSEHTLAAGIAFTKSRTHFIGFDGGDRFQQQGAKVKLPTLLTTAYVFKNTGNRNTFRNIKFIQGSGDAAALTVFQEGGEGTLFKNCSFCFEVATRLGGTTAHEFIAGSDSGTYIDCTFGNDTLVTSGARSVFHVDIVTAEQEFKSNILKNCNFLISSSSGTATFVRLDTITDILYSNTFIDCNFIASVDSGGGAAIAEASQTGTGTAKGCLLYVRPAAFNVTDFTTATGGRNAGTQVVAAVSVAAAIEGIKPTA